MIDKKLQTSEGGQIWYLERCSWNHKVKPPGFSFTISCQENKKKNIANQFKLSEMTVAQNQIDSLQ